MSVLNIVDLPKVLLLLQRRQILVKILVVILWHFLYTTTSLLQNAKTPTPDQGFGNSNWNSGESTIYFTLRNGYKKSLALRSCSLYESAIPYSPSPLAFASFHAITGPMLLQTLLIYSSIGVRFPVQQNVEFWPSRETTTFLTRLATTLVHINPIPLKCYIPSKTNKKWEVLFTWHFRRHIIKHIYIHIYPPTGRLIPFAKDRSGYIG